MNGLPDFIGAGKCGTTSLHNYLNQYLQVYVCPQKETFFLTDELTRQKNQVFNSFLNQPNLLGSTINALMKLFLPVKLRQNLKIYLIQKKLSKTELTPSLRQKLIELYRDDICQLQNLI